MQPAAEMRLHAADKIDDIVDDGVDALR